ncbi:glutathione S-transferase U10-like [Papaver somniferum]|nr:glutathione S-transferase U10-like [Papaver somniferum]
MEKELQSDRIELYGKWSSSYCLRVELALKLKGIPFENMEEDTKNKSEALLKYNPIHKKIPVPVHDGRAIAESLVILEYIDETWTHAPSLLPEDAYERAKARFWENFYDQKFLPSSSAVMKSKGDEERKKAIEDLLENTRLLEEGS